jgi:hypothetical protein
MGTLDLRLPELEPDDPAPTELDLDQYDELDDEEPF